MTRAVDLRVDHPGEAVQGRLGQRCELDDRRGVQGTVRTTRPAALSTAEQPSDGLPVGQVTGHAPGRRSPKLGSEFADQLGAAAAAADQDDVLGALGGEPAGQVRRERAGAAR